MIVYLLVKFYSVLIYSTIMELIVVFSLSSYSHCTSYTTLTTDTGNCYRACDWLFIKSTNIVIPYGRLLSRGSKKIFACGSSYLKNCCYTCQSFTNKVFIVRTQIMNSPSPQYDILSLNCPLKMHPIKFEYDETLTLWKFCVKMLFHK